jgi:single-strand DNA-binding protein
MISYSKTIIVGNCGEQPELRFTPTGNAVSTFNVAVNHYYKNSKGEEKEEVNWHTIVCWNKLAELTNQYLNKGSAVFITGRLSNRNWTSEDGVKHYKTEIVAEKVIFLDTKNNGKVAQPEAESGGDVEPNDIPF